MIEKYRHTVSKIWGKSTIAWLIILLITSLGLRLIIFFTSDPILWPDSYGYIDLAKQILNGDLSNSNGERTPGYPLFLILANINPKNAVMAQFFLGCLIITALYWITYKITQNNFISLIAGASYGLNIAQVQFEFSILTETLTTFLNILSLALLYLVVYTVASRKKLCRLIILIGITSSFAALTRPSFLFLPFLLFIVIWIMTRDFRLSSPVLIFTFFFIGGWSTINYINHGFWGPTSLTGYSLIDLTGAFIEFAPEEYHQIRDIYLDYRSENIQIYGVPLGTQWASLREMIDETGLSFTQLSNAYTDLSLILIIHHPNNFASIGRISWNNFWRPADLKAWSNIKPGYNMVYQHIENMWETSKIMLTALHNIFLYLIIGALIFAAVYRQKLFAGKNLIVVIMSAIVLCSAGVHTLLAFGTPRYLLPTQPLAFCVIFSSAGILGNHIRKNMES